MMPETADVRELTCIVCPVGCRLQASFEDGKVTEVRGNSCKRGAEYAVDELCAPKRTVTSTVRVEGGFLPLVPVRTAAPIPKDKIDQALREVARTRLDAPVRIHQTVIADVAGTGVDVVASRSMLAAG
jgi:CxxC motif-containing protein